MSESLNNPDTSGKKGKKKRSREEEDGGRDGKRQKHDAVAGPDTASTSADASTTIMDTSRKKKKKKDKAKSAGAGAQEAAPNAVVEAVLAAAAQSPDSAAPTQSLDDIINSSGGDMMDLLQGLNVSQLGGVLKGLGSAATASNVQLHSISTTMPTAAPAPRAKKTSGSALPKKRTETGGKKAASGTRTRAPPASLEGFDPSNAAEMLATRWWRPNQLNELAKNHGLVFKKGRFSATEEKQLSVAMEKAAKERGCSLEALDALVFPKSDDERDSAFWAGLARAVPQRSLIAVYHHVRRKRNPLGGRGKWTDTEDDTLRNAVLEHGEQWEKKVSPMVGRSATDCRDRWRNHVKHRGERNSGTWTREEEEKLTRIVNELKAECGKDDDNDLLWTTVAEKMGHTRGRTQCRMKWTQSLRFKSVNEEKRWSQADSFILVHKIDSLDVRDDTEIDWNSLADPDWNSHSGHTMQRRWRHMKRKIDGHETKTHAEIMDVLRATTKYAEPVQPLKPSKPIKPPSKRSPAKPFTSKETVSDSDMD